MNFTGLKQALSIIEDSSTEIKWNLTTDHKAISKGNLVVYQSY